MLFRSNSGIGGTGGPGTVVLLVPAPAVGFISAPGSIIASTPTAPGQYVITYNTPKTASNTYTYIV